QVVLGSNLQSRVRDSLGQSVWATLKMFGPFGAPGDPNPRRNLPGAPALNAWQALPFYVGLLFALWRIRRPSYALILIGLVGLVLPGVFTQHAPHFHRILAATAPTALLCAIGLDQLWQWRPVTNGAHSWSVILWQLHWASLL